LVKVLNSSVHSNKLVMRLEWTEPFLLSVLGPKLKSESPQEALAAFVGRKWKVLINPLVFYLSPLFIGSTFYEMKN